MNLDYWIEQTECVCNSDSPIGGCLHCDLEELKSSRRVVWVVRNTTNWKDEVICESLEAAERWVKDHSPQNQYAIGDVELVKL